MKRGVNSKQKGSAFERKICEALSLWASNGVSKDWYWRAAMSGGRATIHQRSGRDIKACGDICAVSPEGHALTDVFFIETKAYKDLSLDKFLLENKGPLARFWEVCKQQAADHKRCPMLIAKENNKPIVVVTLPGHLDSICEAKGSITLFPEVRPFNTMLGYKFRRLT